MTPSVAKLTIGVARPTLSRPANTMNNDFRIQLGRRIREERSKRGFENGNDFAGALGIDASQLSRLERGLRGIDSVLLRKIATVLEMPLDELFPQERAVGALARRGDSPDGRMEEMIDWALGLRSDLDLVERYVSGSVR